MGRLLMIILKIPCYAGLIFVLSGIGALVVATSSGACPRLDEGGISCHSEWIADLAGYGMMVMLLTVFTGIPGLLAMGGVVFAAIDIGRWIGRRRSKSAARSWPPADPNGPQ